MELSIPQRKKVADYLEKKWKDHHCPLCRTEDWAIAPNLFELRQYFGLGFTTSGAIAPLIAFQCKNCGNTVLVNAIAAGLVNQDTGELIND